MALTAAAAAAATATVTVTVEISRKILIKKSVILMEQCAVARETRGAGPRLYREEAIRPCILSREAGEGGVSKGGYDQKFRRDGVSAESSHGEHLRTAVHPWHR